MNPELLQAYYWLSSAIAQAFAALIALTAMFYIYRIGHLHDRKRKKLEAIFPGILAIEKRYMTVSLQSWSDLALLLLYEELIQDPAYAKIKESLQIARKDYAILSKFTDQLKKGVRLPLILSASAMFLGILLLLLGPLIAPIVVLWIPMAIETLIALFALAFTAKTVIEMLREPEIVPNYWKQVEAILKEPKEPKSEARQE